MTARHRCYSLLASLALTFGQAATAQELPKVSDPIPAQPVAAALDAFSRQTGLQVLYMSRVADGVHSSAIPGGLPSAEALRRLLDATGLEFEFLNDRTVTIVAKESDSKAPAANASSPTSAIGGTNGYARLAQSETTSSPSSSTAAESSGQERVALEEVVVTAQKREQRLLDVPMAIAAISGTELEARGANDYQSLAFAVPELSVAQIIPGQNTLVLRGIGQTGGNLPLVGVYFDEVAASGTSLRPLDLRTFDLERVEVLYGPQGTLYGQGSAGGTVRFITRDPALEATQFSTALDAAFTEDGDPSQRVVAVANVPVVEDKFALRIAGTYENTGGWIDFPAAGKHDVNSADMFNVRVKALWKVTDRFSLNGMFVVHRNDVDNPNGGENANGDFVLGPFAPTMDQPTHNDYDLYSLTGTFDLGGIELLSASSYYSNRTDALYTNPAGARWRVWTDTDRDNVFNQELRLTSKNNALFNWTAGVFYRDADLNQDLLLTQGTGPVPTLVDFAVPLPEMSKSWSLYANGSHNLTDRLELGAGVRYFDDKHSAPLPVGAAEGKFHSVDPRVYLSYAVTNDFKTYISAAKGFRSGGFNPVTPGIPTAFEPDKVYSYELGAKFSSLETRLHGELSAYYSDFRNMQLTTIHPTLFIAYTNNVGKAHIYGVDWSLAFDVTDKLSIGTAGNWVHDRVVEVAPGSAVIKGDRLNYIPDYTYSLFAQSRFNWAANVGGLVRIDYAEKDKSTFASRTAGRFDESDVINLLNARIGATWNKFSLDAYAQNILNDRDKLNPSTVQYWARSRPRTFGLQATVNF